jgi:hypothetical protein
MVPVFLGCETAEDVGIRYELSDNINVQFEEFQLPAVNVYYDSLRSDSDLRLFVGENEDEITGKLTAESYLSLQYVPGSIPNDDFEPTFEFDSVRISLFSDERLLGEDSIKHFFEVYELDRRLVDLVYLSSNKQTLNNKIGESRISMSAEEDTIAFNFQLDDDFGQQLFNQMEDADDINAVEYPSLAITSRDFQTLSEISLTPDTTRVYLYIAASALDELNQVFDTTYVAEFRLTNPSYTYIGRDRSDSQIEGIQENIDFQTESGVTLIDPLAGVRTALDITQLKDFFSNNPRILISSATVLMEFEEEENRELINVFNHFIRKADGSINGAASALDPAGFYLSPQGAYGNIVLTDLAYLNPFNLQQLTPARSVFNTNEDKYLLPSTLFFQTLYRDSESKEGLKLVNILTTESVEVNVENLVAFETNSITLDRSIIKKDGVTLRVYYTEVD